MHQIMNHWRGAFKLLEQDWQAMANEAGLTMAEQHILSILYFEKEATMTEIADLGLWDVSTVMQVVKRLKEKGLVQSKKMPHDRRISYVSLTEEGEETRNRVVTKMRIFDYIEEKSKESEEFKQYIQQLFKFQKEMNEHFHGKQFVEWVDKTTAQLEDESK